MTTILLSMFLVWCSTVEEVSSDLVAFTGWLLPTNVCIGIHAQNYLVGLVA